MHEDLKKLMALQALDLEAKKLRDEMAALPKHVAALDTKAKAIAGQRAVVLDLIAKEEALRRSQESDVKDQQAKVAKGKLKIGNAINTVQVTAFEHEIAFAEKEISRLEEAELESMMRSEELDAQKTVADKALSAAESTHKSERERAIATIAADKIAVAEVDVQRTAQRATIGEDALSLYDRIAKAKGTGIAEALNQKCTALPDDAAPPALERHPRARSHRDDHLRVLRPPPLLRSRTRLPAAQDRHPRTYREHRRPDREGAVSDAPKKTHLHRHG